VTRVKGFEDGLKEALLTKGPMTVSVDAGAESFRFYKRGIYNNTACHTVPVTGTCSALGHAQRCVIACTLLCTIVAVQTAQHAAG